MKDQFKSKRKTGAKTITIIAVFFLFALFYFFSSFFTQIFISGAQLSENIFHSVKSNKDLIFTNKDLQAKLALYENPGNLFYFYKQENEQLKKELGYKEFSQRERKVFNIISKDDSSIYGTFLVNDRSNEVKVGDFAFYQFNLLIGKVVEKIGTLVKVQLFSQAGVTSNFHLTDGGMVKMEVEGMGYGDGVIRVDAPRGIKFQNPDKVFLVDKENNSYLVAELVDIKYKTQDTHKVLYFKIFINQYLLSQIEIQKNNGDNALNVIK